MVKTQKATEGTEVNRKCVDVCKTQNKQKNHLSYADMFGCFEISKCAQRDRFNLIKYLWQPLGSPVCLTGYTLPLCILI